MADGGERSAPRGACVCSVGGGYARDRYNHFPMIQQLRLDPALVVDTARILATRVEERFGARQLGVLARDLVVLAESMKTQSEELSRPWIGVRVVCGIGLVLLLGALITAGLSINLNLAAGLRGGGLEWVSATEAAVNDVVFIGIATWFLLTLEEQLKRRRALRSLHGMRAIAHLIDMHQLTKDPERSVLGGAVDTASSPERDLSPFLLSRYLDYCTEMLALVGKLAALLVQNFSDPVVLGAVNDIEDLTTSLSRKIWQKIDIVGRLAPQTAVEASMARRTDGAVDGGTMAVPIDGTMAQVTTASPTSGTEAEVSELAVANQGGGPPAEAGSEREPG